MSLFDKELSDLTTDDLNELIEDKISEDEFLEYKKTLSANKGDDKWITGADSVGEKAITNLAKEIVAFANTSGGYLILGMAEEGKIKPFASKLNPIPRIVELSERLKASFRNVIEPTLNSIRYHPIVIEGGKGVLVIKVERSQNAPHRSLKDKECYFRRNDSSEKMSMREIKNITISRFNSDQNISRIFLDRKEKFEQNFYSKKLPYRSYKEVDENRIGLRFTFIPISDEISLPNLFEYLSSEDVNTNEIVIKFEENARNYSLHFPFYSTQKNAIIRGVRFFQSEYNIEVYQDGLVEVTLIIDNSLKKEPILYVDWFLRLFYNGVKAIEKIKTNLLSSEFYFEAQIVSTENEFKAKTFSESLSSTKSINSQSIDFPRYSYLKLDDIKIVSQTLIEDFYGMCEAHFSFDIIIEPSSIIK